jgi:hypothetical protein
MCEIEPNELLEFFNDMWKKDKIIEVDNENFLLDLTMNN